MCAMSQEILKLFLQSQVIITKIVQVGVPGDSAEMFDICNVKVILISSLKNLIVVIYSPFAA